MILRGGEDGEGRDGIITHVFISVICLINDKEYHVMRNEEGLKCCFRLDT